MFTLKIKKSNVQNSRPDFKNLLMLKWVWIFICLFIIYLQIGFHGDGGEMRNILRHRRFKQSSLWPLKNIYTVYFPQILKLYHFSYIHSKRDIQYIEVLKYWLKYIVSAIKFIGMSSKSMFKLVKLSLSVIYIVIQIH